MVWLSSKITTFESPNIILRIAEQTKRVLRKVLVTLQSQGNSFINEASLNTSHLWHACDPQVTHGHRPSEGELHDEQNQMAKPYGFSKVFFQHLDVFVHALKGVEWYHLPVTN